VSGAPGDLGTTHEPAPPPRRGEREVDWAWLREAAEEAAGRAYAPYSRLRVGAAALVEDGRGGSRVVRGCNVENASYGLTLCAECGVVSQLHAGGGGRLVALVCVGVGGPGAAAGAAVLLAPCGRCRQLLREHGGLDLLVLRPGGVRTLAELLPDSFGPDALPADAR